MRAFAGGEHQTKLCERLPEIQHRLFENQETCFILHSSLYHLGIKASIMSQAVSP
jgi:hypothetical protein